MLQHVSSTACTIVMDSAGCAERFIVGQILNTIHVYMYVEISPGENFHQCVSVKIFRALCIDRFLPGGYLMRFAKFLSLYYTVRMSHWRNV